MSFDTTWMSLENISGGIFHYSYRLIYAMVKYSNVNVVVIIRSCGQGIFEHLLNHQNFKLIQLDSPNLFNELIKREGIDIVHTPRQEHFNFTLTVPMINTLHDLQQFHYPGFFSEQELQYRENFYRKSAEFSERVIVSFPHVKDDIVRFYQISPDKIDVCPFGMIEPLRIDQRRFDEVKKKYRLPDRYLFYSAGSWRHKNHIGLIRAVKVLHDKYGIKIPLICTGYQYKDFFPQIESIVHELGMKEYVRFLGYLPEEDMPLLLSNATLVVIPTLYEAGSFPLMEAMAYRVPVICSNVTSLPDTIGNPQFIFDPNNVKQMAELMVRMLNDPVLMEENRRNSQARTREGGWDNAVHCFVNTYRRAVEDFRQKRNASYVQKCIAAYEGDIDILKAQLAERTAELEAKQKLLEEMQGGPLKLVWKSVKWRLKGPMQRFRGFFMQKS